MTDERAMEILDPNHREHYDGLDEVNEACRMGMEAIKQVKELQAENDELRERVKELSERNFIPRKENGWAERQIIRCLKVAKEGGAFTYRRNFSADVLELIEELKAENAELRARVGRTVDGDRI